jgi:hypothetical protein
MMIAETITSFLAVVDRLIQLTDRREKLNRNTFTDFVVPVMADFEAVHNDYIDSFRRYLDKIGDTSIPLWMGHPVLEELQRDSLLSINLRTKALALTRMPELDPRLKRFASTIEGYFDCAIVNPHSLIRDGDWFLCNYRRKRVFTLLLKLVAKRSPDFEKRARARRIFKSSLVMLQSRYDCVFSEFSDLRIQFLTPV